MQATILSQPVIRNAAASVSKRTPLRSAFQSTTAKSVGRRFLNLLMAALSAPGV